MTPAIVGYATRKSLAPGETFDIPYPIGDVKGQRYDFATVICSLGTFPAGILLTSGAQSITALNATGQTIPRDTQLTLYLQRANDRDGGVAATVGVVGNSIIEVGGALTLSTGQTTRWVPSTAKALTNTVVPTTEPHYSGFSPALYYECTTAGTTASGWDNEPDWPTASGQTIQDGSVIWTARAQADIAMALGWWTLAQALSGQRLQEIFYCGLSQKKVAECNTKFDKLLGMNPSYVAFMAWPENDIWPNTQPVLATITAQWTIFQRRMDEARAAGRTVILLTPFPNGNCDSNGTVFTGYSSGNGTKCHYWWCAKVREYAARYRDSVIFYDAAAAYIDPNVSNPIWPENTTTYLSASGAGQELKKTDGIHPQMAANWIIGNGLATVLRNTIPAIDHFATGAGDAYNITANPLNYGTAGSASTGVTGNVANFMTMICNAGTAASATASKVTRTDAPGEWQRAVYTATVGDNVSFSNTANIALSGKAAQPGNTVQLFSEIRVLANPTLFTYPQCYVRFRTSAPANCTEPHRSFAWGVVSNQQDLGQFITTDTTFILKTHPTKIPADAANVIVDNRGFGRGACTFTIDFGRQVCKSVSTPALS